MATPDRSQITIADANGTAARKPFHGHRNYVPRGRFVGKGKILNDFPSPTGLSNGKPDEVKIGGETVAKAEDDDGTTDVNEIVLGTTVTDRWQRAFSMAMLVAETGRGSGHVREGEPEMSDYGTRTVERSL